MKKVMTVLGEIAADALGVTMPHEHIVCDISRESGRPDNRLNDVQLAAREVALYKEAGGATIVDVTTEDIGRNPLALKTVSEASAVNIITTTGYYSEELFAEHVLDVSVDALAAHMIREIKEGIGDTGIRPGIIGEIKSAGERPTPAEEKVHRAAARTHKETGLAIVLHSGYHRPAPQQLAIVAQEGVPPERVLVSHADIEWHENMQEDMDYFLPLLDQGCTLGFDTIGWQEFSPEPERIRRIRALVERGFAGQIVLASDLCRRSFYHANGGRGYDYVLREFVPKLRACGVPQADIDPMLVENPKRILAYG